MSDTLNASLLGARDGTYAVKIVNTRQADISVSITATGEAGGEDWFFKVDANGGSGIWQRGHMQVATVYLHDARETRIMVVLPGGPDYNIS